jgi:hypothetical protein
VPVTEAGRYARRVVGISQERQRDWTMMGATFIRQI